MKRTQAFVNKKNSPSVDTECMYSYKIDFNDQTTLS